jgi:hypothetical protein
MDRRQDEVVLVEQRHTGLVAGGVRRIQRQFGQKPLAGWIAARDLFKLDEVGAPRLGVLVNAFQVRFIPEPRPFEVDGSFRITQVADGPNEGFPVIAGAGRRGQAAKCCEWIGCFRHLIEYALRGPGPDAGQKMQQPEAGDAVARILGEAQQRQHVLDVRGIEKFQAAELHERDIATGEFDFERSAVARRPEQDGLLLQERAGFAVLQDALDDAAGLVGLIADGDQLRLCARRPLRPELLGERSRARSMTPLAAARIVCVDR